MTHRVFVTGDACVKSPARVKQALTLGATDKTDSGASFTNTGACVDVFGPGVLVESDRPGGGFAEMSGTSMACPHGTGVAALYLERHPEPSPAEVNSGVLALASKDKLRNIGPSTSPNLLLYAKEP